MANEQKVSPTPENLPIGKRLQKSREALSLSIKDVASQLRLNERIIQMMEKQEFPHTLPLTYIRGYLRTYSRFLEIPEKEILNAIQTLAPDPIKDTPMPQPERPPLGNYLMRFLTSFIFFTLIGLVAMWCYNEGPNFYLSKNNENMAKDTYADNNTIGVPFLPDKNYSTPSDNSAPLYPVIRYSPNIARNGNKS